MSVARTLFHRASCLSSNSQHKISEFKRIRDTLSCNGFPKMNANDVIFSKPRSEEVTGKRADIPYVRGCSERICRILKRFNIPSLYKPLNKLCHIFNLPKDPIPPNSICGVVSEVSCKDCKCVYVGQTKNSLDTRLSQHRAACRLLQPEKSALAEHSITRSLGSTGLVHVNPK